MRILDIIGEMFQISTHPFTYSLKTGTAMEVTGLSHTDWLRLPLHPFKSAALCISWHVVPRKF